MTNGHGAGPRRVCFMVMPYGTRATGIKQSGAPLEIDFDRLWDEAIFPALEDCGYQPIRADMDLGALIIKEMLERLVIAHIVIADITLPNGNVYYELGVRHAAKERGCVMLCADWARPLFDINQMPRLLYPLGDGAVGEEAAKAIRAHLVECIPSMVDGTSPVYQSVPGYPDADPATAESFKEFVNEVADLQGKMRAARRSPKSQRAGQAKALLAEVAQGPQPPTAVALELMYLVRDLVSWEGTITYIKNLPNQTQQLPLVREQMALAHSKAGDHLKAIGALEALIELSGETSERRGLLGGCYKNLMRATKSDDDRAEYLDRAIENYQRGTELDLNDFYPTCNLAPLYRRRAAQGDEKRAQAAAAITLAAIHRAMASNPSDEWIRPTLLGAAFHDGNVQEAQTLFTTIKREGVAQWKLKTTLDDLRDALERLPDPAVREQLQEVYDKLAKLAG